MSFKLNRSVSFMFSSFIRGLSECTSPLNRNCHNLSYVQRMKKFQYVTEKNALDDNMIKHGRYLVYYRSKPFLTENFKIMWLDFSDLNTSIQMIKESCVLLGLTSNNQLQIAVQLGNLENGIKENIEKTLNGSFQDFRPSLLMMPAGEASLASKANAVLNWHKKNTFCSNCGSQSVRSPSGSTRTCYSCGTIHYPSLSPVGIATVSEASNSKLLLVRQSRHPKGMYSCIAGFVDSGETLEDSIKREVAEEVGLTVRSVDYKVSQHWSFPTSNLMIGCHAVVDGDEVLDIDKGELEDAKWFPIEDIKRSLFDIKKDPLKVMQKQEFFVPPRGTVAHSLIDSWISQLTS